LGIPCAGIIPFAPGLDLDDEDGVAFERKRAAAAPFDRDDADPGRRLRVAVVALPRLANATDFDPLAAESDVALRFCDDAAEIAAADLVVLPGSKSTIADYDWLAAHGFVPALRQHAAARKPLLGICGGLQMLGETVADPDAVEGGGTRATLGLLPLSTTLGREKTTREVRARLVASLLFGSEPLERAFDGYEIHMGTSHRGPACGPAAEHEFGTDGAASADGMIVGTYVHGIFDDDGFRDAVLIAARRAAGRHERETRLAVWAAHVAAHLDLDLIRSLIGR
jgi:adenosylcobyric acid synthase